MAVLLLQGSATLIRQAINLSCQKGTEKPRLNSQGNIDAPAAR